MNEHIEAMARALCKLHDTKQCAALCLSNLPTYAPGQCEFACQVWGKQVTAALAAYESLPPTDAMRRKVLEAEQSPSDAMLRAVLPVSNDGTLLRGVGHGYAILVGYGAMMRARIAELQSSGMAPERPAAASPAHTPRRGGIHGGENDG